MTCKNCGKLSMVTAVIFVCAFCLAGSAIAESRDIVEGGSTKEHPHSESPFRPTNERGYGMMVSVTTSTPTLGMR